MAGRKSGSGQVRNSEPLVQQLFDHIRAHQTATNTGEAQIAEAVGLGRNTLQQWRSRHSPTIHNYKAMAHYLGFELVLLRKEAGTGLSDDKLEQLIEVTGSGTIADLARELIDTRRRLRSQGGK